MALHHHVQHALVLITELILPQFSEPQAGLQHDVAGALLELAAEHFYESRLYRSRRLRR